MNLQSFLSAMQHQVLHWTAVLSTPPQSVERYLKNNKCLHAGKNHVNDLD